MRFFGHLLCFFACFCMVGGHWAALQGVAWAGMLQEYSERYGLREAAAITFSGEKPCEMCLSISEGREKEQKQQEAPDRRTVKVDKSIDALISIAPTPAQPSRQADLQWPAFLSLFASIPRIPPSPPPRAS